MNDVIIILVNSIGPVL